jgi:glycosyltransferase involved in cell wall biosynthesis
MNNGKKIKVAEVVTRLDWGGSPDIVRITCKYLDASIYDIRLIAGTTKNASGRTRQFLDEMGERVIMVPQLGRDINPVRDLAALVSLYRIFKRERFDIVHTHTAKAGALGRIAAHMAGVPVVIHTPHGHNFYGYFGPVFSRLILLIERFLTRYTDKLIALTALEKRDYEVLNVAKPEKVRLIYQGLEIELNAAAATDRESVRKELGLKNDEKVVGMVSRLEPIKGPLDFVEAARYIAEKFPAAKFILVGEGSLRNSLEDKIRSLGLKEKFILTGWRDDVRRVISSFDLLVLSSLNEAVGIVLIEAQAEGVPVIATNVGGIPEIIKDGETGLLVNPSDPEELARAVSGLLADDKKASAMAIAGRQWVMGRFEASAMAKDIAGLYQELLKEKGHN